jgi:anti-sigma28 factor (negative regulator of flagellin synthesis)
MTNGVLSSTVSSAYANNLAKNSSLKEGSKDVSMKNDKQETKVEKLKAQIESGNYKIDIDKLAKKMAEELIS